MWHSHLCHEEVGKEEAEEEAEEEGEEKGAVYENVQVEEMEEYSKSEESSEKGNDDDDSNFHTETRKVDSSSKNEDYVEVLLSKKGLNIFCLAIIF